MTKKQKKQLRNILTALAVFLVVWAIPFEKLPFPDLANNILELCCFIVAFLLAGFDVVKKAVLNLIHGNPLDECFLMAVATIGAFFVGEYPEGVAVMIFYQIGEFFQSYAVGKSRKSIKSLLKIRPDKANLLKDGTEKEVDPAEVNIGDIIIVRAGERIPLDGRIVEGVSSLDTAALTGESLPRDVEVGDEAISGCINLRGTIKVQVVKTFGESTVSRILNMVENASENKAKAENFITKFARIYTPVVVGLAVVLAIIPPLVLKQSFADWIYRALSFLVVSCPCALVISIPLGFFGGIGGAAKAGILFKGSNYMETLANAKAFVFDKTGTLTYGNFKVTKLEAIGFSEEELLKYAGAAESDSSHPIALSIRNEFEARTGHTLVCTKEENGAGIYTKDIEELAGFGVRATIDGREVLVGNKKLLDGRNINSEEKPSKDFAGTAVYVAIDGRYAGFIGIEDEIKSDSAEAIKALRSLGIQKEIMLTGDRENVAKNIAGKLGLDDVRYELLPEDKVSELEKIIKETDGALVYVGDGINDAPVLARADVGMAMGGLGADAAIEAADIVIMTDETAKLPAALKIAKRTLAIVKQNVVFAIGVKVLILILSALGLSTMWWAVFGDVGVCVLAILNSMRAMKVK